MSNSTAYDVVTEIARTIKNSFAPDHRASVAVAEDPAHALELLSAGKSGGCAIVIFYLSDNSDDEVDDVRVAAQIRVAIVQAPGLRLRDGQTAPSVLQVIDDFRKWIKTPDFQTVLGGALSYKGMTHIPSKSGEALHGYAMTYEAEYAYETE